jgi:hypothetical protein
MRGLTKWWGAVAVCAALAGGPVHAATELPATTFGAFGTPTPVAAGGVLRVKLTLEKPFDFLTMDASALLDGSLFALPALSPLDVPFDSEALETVLDQEVTGTLGVTGALALSSFLKFDFFNPPTPDSPTAPWPGAVLFEFDLAISGLAQAGSYSVLFSFIADDGVEHPPTGRAQLDLTVVDVTEIPEPSTWALLLAGLAGLGFMARRRRA